MPKDGALAFCRLAGVTSTKRSVVPDVLDVEPLALVLREFGVLGADGGLNIELIRFSNTWNGHITSETRQQP